MTAPVLDEVERVAEAATASLLETTADLDSLIQIDGRATAGKTACLAAIADRLRQSDRGLIPIVVGPPARHLDTGPLALADIAVALKHAGAVNGEFDEWANGKHTWRSRADLVRRWIRRDNDRVVLLCDEPEQWRPSRADTDLFSDRADDVARLVVLESPCRRVVAGRMPASLRAHERYSLDVSTPSLEWLTDATTWGTLAESARQLGDSDIDIEGRTPLECGSLWPTLRSLRWTSSAMRCESPVDAASWLTRSRKR